MEKILLKRGVNDCKIVIPENAHVVEKTAAEELCNYIEKSLSIKLSVVSESEAEGKCIYVGHTEYAKKRNILGKSKENWIIAMADGNLVLTGGEKRGDRGIIYAAYHFLEENVGVRWWSAYEEDVLALDSLSIADDFYKEGTPFFPYRKPFLDSQCGVERYAQMPRVRVNTISPLDDGILDGAYDPDVRKYGDVISHGRPHHTHTMPKYFNAEETFKEHPEWFAWNEKEQRHLPRGHFCFSNEEFFNTLLNKLLAYMEEDEKLAKETGVELPTYYSLALDDKDASYYFCQCPKCRAILEKSGFSGYVLNFVNRIAREVKKKHPWARIESLCYVIFSEPPKDDTVPEENVVIRIAADRSDILHGFREPWNRVYLRWLREWSERCKVNGASLHIYQYMYHIQIHGPFPIFWGLQSFMKGFAEYGVEGVFSESQNQFSDCWDLNKYVFTHLLEDPDCDVDALASDFCDRYYGKAGKAVYEYLEVIRDAMYRNITHNYCMCDDTELNFIDARAAIDGAKALDRAAEVIGDNKLYRARLAFLRKALDGVILNRYFDFKRQAEKMGESFDFDIPLLKKRVAEALREFLTLPNAARYEKRVEDEIEYYSNLPEKDEVLDIPEYFKDVDLKDIWQYRPAYATKTGLKVLREVFGLWPVEDSDTTVSKSLKISYDNCRGSQRENIMVPSSKKDGGRPLNFSLYQDNEVVGELNLYREDLIQGGYNIYKVGHVDNIANYPDTSLIAYDYGFLSIKINGLLADFPMEACDVYLSMKPSGELYGGNSDDENALFIDRLIVVRTK